VKIVNRRDNLLILEVKDRLLVGRELGVTQKLKVPLLGVGLIS